MELGGHSSAPDRNGDGRFSPGFDANWRAEKLWGTRDIQAATGMGALGDYKVWMTFPRPMTTRCFSPRLMQKAFVKLSLEEKAFFDSFARELPVSLRGRIRLSHATHSQEGLWKPTDDCGIICEGPMTEATIAMSIL